jgi:hypothetical protein
VVVSVVDVLAVVSLLLFPLPLHEENVSDEQRASNTSPANG